MTYTFEDEILDLVKNRSYRSLIVEKDVYDDCPEDIKKHMFLTNIDDNSYYITLSEEGVLDVLIKDGISEKNAETLRGLILTKEKDQEYALANYLKLKRELTGSVVYVMIRDGMVDPDEDMFKDTYCLPIDKFFSVLSNNNFRPVHTRRKRATSSICEKDYGGYLFANKNFHKILTVFIDVSFKESDS